MLFTEDQWRAIAEIERRTEHSWMPCEYGQKRIYGPLFSDGEYYLTISMKYPLPHVGPPAPQFRVRERLSGLIFTWTLPNRADVIAGARYRIARIGPEYYAVMLAKAKEKNAEFLARSAAQAAIAKARADKKAASKKMGKRRKEIFAESGGKCHYCATALTLDGKWHVEHKMPKILGGTNDRINLVAACAPCNHKKRDKTDVEFFALLREQSAPTPEPAKAVG